MTEHNLPKTEKLYDETPYETTFSASVLWREDMENQGVRVVLDRTLFFPEEGGQTPDRGVLGGFFVTDVQIQEDVILHTLQGPVPADSLLPGAKVEGEISWEHRFDDMQQHSGEHIFSGLVHSLFGYDNVGFHLSDNIVTMDYNGELSAEQLMEVEERTNHAIYLNLAIHAYYPSSQELGKLSYRSKKEIDGRLRIVEIPGYDICACCAPHVKNTGEIGMLKVVSRQNYKGGTRISIVCGQRAIRLFQEEHGLLTELAAHLSTSADQIPAIMEKQQKEIYELRGSLTQLGAALLQEKAEKIPAEQRNAFLFARQADPKAVREIINGLCLEHEGYCGVFTGSDEEGYSFIIGSGKEQQNAGDAAKLLKEKFGARGGGSPLMVQGQVKASELLLLEALATI